MQEDGDEDSTVMDIGLNIPISEQCDISESFKSNETSSSGEEENLEKQEMMEALLYFQRT